MSFSVLGSQLKPTDWAAKSVADKKRLPKTMAKHVEAKRSETMLYDNYSKYGAST
jgi:hypothetical protein